MAQRSRRSAGVAGRRIMSAMTDGVTANERDWHDPSWAAVWDSDHLRGNPVRKEHLDLLLDLAGELRLRSVLDLGCGSGIVADLLLGHLGEVSLVGLDSSRAMLDLARRRLAAHGPRARLVVADLGQPERIGSYGPFDAAIAVQSLHHLEAERLGPLLRWVRSELAPGGWLLIADRIRIPDAALYPVFRRSKERAGHDRNPAAWDEYVASLDRSHDRPEPLDRYLALLHAAGFTAGCVDCRVDRAFLVARTPPG
jgi:tRNA (cmo5U34)-methyltransferase